MSLNYTVNTDFNSDSEFSECELDVSWATLQVKKLLETSGSTTIEINGTSFNVTSNETFLNAVKAMVALNVSASIASGGCATVSSLPVGIAPIPAGGTNLVPIVNLRFNRVHGEYGGTNIPKKPTSLYDSVGNCNPTFESGNKHRWSWPNSDLPEFTCWDNITLTGLGNNFGNGDFTLDFKFKPDNLNKNPGEILNKADRFKVWIGTTSIFIQAGNGGKTINNFDLSSYSSAELVHLVIVYKTVKNAEKSLIVYVNGTKLLDDTVWNDLFTDTTQLNADLAIKFMDKWSKLQEFTLLSDALDVNNISEISNKPYLPIVPLFYTDGNVERGTKEFTFNNTVATIEGIVNHLVSFEQTDSSVAGDRSWINNTPTRTGIKIGYNRKLKIPLDFSKDFTISFWAYFNGDPKTFMKIYDGDGESSGNRLDIMAWMKNWWMVKHFTDGSENTLTRYNNFGNSSIFPHREASQWGGYAQDDPDNKKFVKNAWNHVTIAKNGDLLQFFINKGYDRRRTGNYVWVNASKVNNQGESTLEFSTQSTEYFLSELYVIPGSVVPALLYKAPNNGDGVFKEIDDLASDNYFIS